METCFGNISFLQNISTFYRDYAEKLIATFPSIDFASLIARPTIKPTVKLIVKPIVKPSAKILEYKRQQPTKANGNSKRIKKSKTVNFYFLLALS